MNRKYVLITCAYNEEKYIEKAILSVVNQTIKPEKYIIVSDNSTDKTDDIIKGYELQWPFIKYIRRNDHEKNNFASKVYAFNKAVEYLANYDYDFIGCVDADISFNDSYYSEMLDQFVIDDALGIVGGKLFDIINEKAVDRKGQLYSIPGGIMFFRKECYANVNGFMPLKHGGEDSVVEILARFHGWKLKTIIDSTIIHNKPTLGLAKNKIHACFKKGIINYTLCYHPLFLISSCIFRLRRRPIIIGSIIILAGYLYSYLTSKEQAFQSKEIKKFIKKEQLKRLYQIFRKNN